MTDGIEVTKHLRCPKCGTELKASDVEENSQGDLVLLCSRCFLQVLLVEQDDA